MNTRSAIQRPERRIVAGGNKPNFEQVTAGLSVTATMLQTGRVLIGRRRKRKNVAARAV